MTSCFLICLFYCNNSNFFCVQKLSHFLSFLIVVNKNSNVCSLYFWSSELLEERSGN